MRLHHRSDEEPEQHLPLIDRQIWWYPGCRFCGWETHRERECPNRPGYTAQREVEGQVQRPDPHDADPTDGPLDAAPGHVEAAAQAGRVETSALTAGV